MSSDGDRPRSRTTTPSRELAGGGGGGSDLGDSLLSLDTSFLVTDEAAPPKLSKPEPRVWSNTSPKSKASTLVSIMHAQRVGKDVDEQRLAEIAQEEEMLRLALERSLSELNNQRSLANLSVASYDSDYVQMVQAEAEKTEAIIDSPHTQATTSSTQSRRSVRRTSSFDDPRGGRTPLPRQHSGSSVGSRRSVGRTNSASSVTGKSPRVSPSTTTQNRVPIRIGPLPAELLKRASSRSLVGAEAVLEVARANLSPEEVEVIELALRKGIRTGRSRRADNMSSSHHSTTERSLDGSRHSKRGGRRSRSYSRSDSRSDSGSDEGPGSLHSLSQNELCRSDHTSRSTPVSLDRSGSARSMTNSSSHNNDQDHHAPAWFVKQTSGRRLDARPQAVAEEYDLSGASEHLTEEELRQIQQALVGEFVDDGKPSADLGPGQCLEAEQGISAEEAASIEQALREADQAEELKSLQLALQIQEEEQRQLRLAASSRQNQGNVRTMTRSELEAEARVGAFQAFERPAPHPLEQDVYEPPVAAGFRMNSTARQEWQRRDQHTVMGPDNEVRTKHDVMLDGYSNAHRLGLEEDEYGAMANVGNKAYNSFIKSVNKTKKGVAAHGTGRAGSDAEATRGGAMDPNVRVQISKAINQGLIERCNGAVKEGKEAVIYHADRGDESGGFDVAIKVFKRIQEFKGRGDYVDGDPRYSRDGFRKVGTREQVELWAEKEFRNLIRANRAGVPVPTPLEQKENILFMRFLGADCWPAPQLREINLKRGSKKWDVLYAQIMGAIRDLYKKGRLVHGDLSEYNILVAPAFLVENKAPDIENEAEDLQAVLIDFGQSVDTRHPDSTILLQRDLERVNSFFIKQGANALSAELSLAYVVNNDPGPLFGFR